MSSSAISSSDFCPSKGFYNSYNRRKRHKNVSRKITSFDLNDSISRAWNAFTVSTVQTANYGPFKFSSGINVTSSFGPTILTNGSKLSSQVGITRVAAGSVFSQT